MRSVREMRKIQSEEGAKKKARENTAPIEVQQHEPVPAEDNFANVNENGEFELPVDSCSTEFKLAALQLILAALQLILVTLHLNLIYLIG